MTESSSEARRNLYKQARSPYWFLRITLNGRKMRISTKTSDLPEAIEIRDRWLKTRRRRWLKTENGENLGWEGWVRSQLADPRSWLRLTFSRMRRRHRKSYGMGRCVSLGELGAAVTRCAGICEVTGVALKRPGTGGLDPMNASVDRRNSSIGYTAENIRIVALALNFAMNRWGEEPIRQLIVARSGQKQGIPGQPGFDPISEVSP